MDLTAAKAAAAGFGLKVRNEGDALLICAPDGREIAKWWPAGLLSCEGRRAVKVVVFNTALLAAKVLHDWPRQVRAAASLRARQRRQRRGAKQSTNSASLGLAPASPPARLVAAEAPTLAAPGQAVSHK